MRKRHRLIAGLAVLSLTLTGCAGIPRSGPVEEGAPVTIDDDLPLDFLPAGPAKGAAQRDIVLGFIEAALSPQGAFKTAKEFLTTSFANVWKPLQTVTIYQGTPEVQQQDTTTVELKVAPVAEVDENGQHTELASAAPITSEFEFVQQAGQWRISQAPDGIFLERLNFDQVFSPYPLYFFDPTYTHLVPDLRWFPSRAAPGTRIVKALLQGPSPWLAAGNAVISAFPPGTALSADTVPIDARDAMVDLNSEALNADELTWQRMQLQLTRSLGQVASVSTVTITVNLNEKETPPLVIGEPRVDGRPLVYQDGLFGFLSSAGDLTEIPGISAQVEALQPVAAVLGSGQQSAAVLAADGGVYRVEENQAAPVLLDSREGLIPPSMDPFGNIWSVPSDSPNDVLVFAPDNSAQPVQATWPEATSIASLDVSRDGARMLALVADSGVPRLVVAAIIRGDKGIPAKLGEPIECATADGTPIDATWIDELNVISMTRSEEGENQVVAQQVGGPSGARGTTENGVAIVGGNTISAVRILASDGTLLAQRGTAWQETATDIDVLATQVGTVH